MSSGVLIKIPSRYRPIYDAARRQQRAYKERGVDVPLFKIMNEIMDEEKRSPVKVFRL